MRFGLLTSGGDCPGLNAAIRGVVRVAVGQRGHEVIGFSDAWRGVLEGVYTELTVDHARGLLPRGGTILGTSRIQPYQTSDGVETVRQRMRELDLDGFVVIGGDGSLSCARDLTADGVPCIGVPKTIDNDIGATEMTFGFDTAVSIASEAVDRLHTTAESHDRVMVLEVMGRHAGHIAARSGLAGGAAVILIPERPFDIAEVAESIRLRHAHGRWASIVVVAEGAVPKEGTLELPEAALDRFGHRRLGGVGQVVAQELERRTGFEARCTVLGYVQRGGTPSAFDRILATRFGVAAAHAAHDGAWGTMVALQADQIVRVPLADAVGRLKLVDDAFIDEVLAPFVLPPFAS